MKKRRYKRLQDWEKQAIADMLRAGEKIAVIMTEFDISVSHLHRVRDAEGVPARRFCGNRPAIQLGF